MKITLVIDSTFDLELAQRAFAGEIAQQKVHEAAHGGISLSEALYDAQLQISRLEMSFGYELPLRSVDFARFQDRILKEAKNSAAPSMRDEALRKAEHKLNSLYAFLRNNSMRYWVEVIEELREELEAAKETIASLQNHATIMVDEINASDAASWASVVAQLREELASAIEARDYNASKIAEYQELARGSEALREALMQTGKVCAEQEQRIHELEQELNALKNATKPQRTRKPKADAPVVDAPVVDAPVVDAPVVDALVVDAPVVDAPVVDALVVEEDEADVLFPGNADAPFQAGHYSKLLSKFKDMASKKPMLYHVHLKARVLQAAGIEDSGALIMQQITTFGAARLAWRELCKMEEEERGA